MTSARDGLGPRELTCSVMTPPSAPASVDARVGGGPVIRQPANRLFAWTVDSGCALAWAAVTAAVGIPLYRAGVTRSVAPVALNIIAAATVVLPVTVCLAWFESRAREATVGKRMRRLVVLTASNRSRLTFARALGRNAAKVMLPWLVGHAAVFAIVEASASAAIPVGVVVLTGSAYLLPIVYIASVFIGTGRTPYDRLAGTIVIRVPDC